MKSNKITKEEYSQAIIELPILLKHSPAASLNEFCTTININKSLPQALIEMGVINKVDGGHKWGGVIPSFKMVVSYLSAKSENGGKVTKKTKAKKIVKKKSVGRESRDEHNEKIEAIREWDGHE